MAHLIDHYRDELWRIYGEKFTRRVWVNDDSHESVDWYDENGDNVSNISGIDYEALERVRKRTLRDKGDPRLPDVDCY